MLEPDGALHVDSYMIDMQPVGKNGFLQKKNVKSVRSGTDRQDKLFLWQEFSSVTAVKGSVHSAVRVVACG